MYIVIEICKTRLYEMYVKKNTQQNTHQNTHSRIHIKIRDRPTVRRIGRRI